MNPTDIAPVLHQWVDNGPRLNVKVEKNTRGTNYEVTVTGARTPEEAIKLLKETTDALKTEYGG